MISRWCPIPRTHSRSPARTLSFRDRCEWSALTARTGSATYLVRTTRRRSSGLEGGSSPREPRSDVEWHSVLQTKSRDKKWDPRDRLSQLPVQESGGADPIVRGTRIWRPGRDIAVRIIAFFFYLILFHPCSRDFLPWSHWSSIRSRRNRRGSCPTGSKVSPRPCTRIAGWELSMTAQRGALNSLTKDDKQSGTHEERGPDVKT